MNAPAVVQNLGWAILGTWFFVIGVALAAVTGSRTMTHYKNSQDTMSVDAWKALASGGTLAAIFLTTGIYAVIRFGGTALSQLGIA